MESINLLCNTFYCRLCAEENTNGTDLFSPQENANDLIGLINRYLPLKVENNGKLPTKVCPGCHIQLEATKSFMDLIVEGQRKLRDMWNYEQDLLLRQEKQKNQLQQVLNNVNPASKVETYTIQSDETGEKFLIQIFSDGPLFPPEHELSIKCEGLERPRKKRGRPPKLFSVEKQEKDVEDFSIETSPQTDDQTEEPELDENDGRRRRRVKAPSRYQGVVQGKEMEKMLMAEGVSDDEHLAGGTTLEGPTFGSNKERVIGRMETKDGEDMGQLIVVNPRNKFRVRHNDIRKRKKYQCKLCKKEFLHFGRYSLHKNEHQVEYICQEKDCDFRNGDTQYLQEHQNQTKHSGVIIKESLAGIGTMEVTSTGQDSLLATITAEEEEDLSNDFVCKVCNKSFSCKQNFEVHSRSVHNQERPFVCTHCERRFAHSNSLRLHYNSHIKSGAISEAGTPRQYPCEDCDKVFLHPSSLIYHRNSQHSNGRRFVCNKCNKSFKHRQLLQRHQLVHSEERPHKCMLCQAAFKTRANLINHTALHSGQKKYWCTTCDQSFAHKTSLTLHRRWHLGLKPYQCDVCKKTFSQKGNLAEHRRIHTGEKPYACDHCDRAFTTSSQMRLHRKRHTGERPWRCEYCPKTFLHKDTWKCHTRRHLNDRPYKCKACQRSFSEAWALKKHERLHTGERPYKCEQCGKGFADNSNLTKHKKIHNTVYKQVVQIKDGSLEVKIEEMDNSTQLRQLVDQQGNPISFITQDGQQVPVVTGDDDHRIQGLLPDGTLVPLDISAMADDNKLISTLPELDDTPGLMLNNGMGFFSDQMIKPETDIAVTAPTTDPKLDTNIQFLTGDNCDGMCLVTTYTMDDSTATLSPQFLTMP